MVPIAGLVDSQTVRKPAQKLEVDFSSVACVRNLKGPELGAGMDRGLAELSLSLRALAALSGCSAKWHPNWML